MFITSKTTDDFRHLCCVFASLHKSLGQPPSPAHGGKDMENEYTKASFLGTVMWVQAGGNGLLSFVFFCLFVWGGEITPGKFGNNALKHRVSMSRISIRTKGRSSNRNTRRADHICSSHLQFMHHRTLTYPVPMERNISVRSRAMCTQRGARNKRAAQRPVPSSAFFPRISERCQITKVL